MIMKKSAYQIHAIIALMLSVSLLSSCSKTTDTPPPVFTVTTTPVTLITATTARSGGSITVTSGTPVIIEKGVCYSTTANPTITSYTVPITGSSVAIFTSDITGLTANTTYHVRAYTVDESGAKYGEDLTFTTNSTPVVTTAATSSITQTTATSGGNVTSDGGSAVTERGVCYATTQNPTTASTKIVGGTGTGSFTSSITGLTATTTYYVRAYATNSVGTSYGSQVTFTTLANLPTVTTTAVSAITTTTATSGGNITSSGGATVTASGICWGTSANPTITDSHTTGSTATGAFSSNMTGLTANTGYHVRAYATNSVGTAYGEDVAFNTLPVSLAIGDAFGGGIVAYIFQSGDAGYVAGQVHGLIAATSDQSAGIAWAITASNITTTVELLGYGNANTIAIVNNQGVGTYAAKLCYDLVLDGYSDWYLPSNNELKKLYDNKINIGGFSTGKYWTSTQGVKDAYNIYPAMSLDFSTGVLSAQYKSTSLSVRAIRSF